MFGAERSAEALSERSLSLKESNHAEDAAQMEDDAPVIYGLEFQVLLLHCGSIHSRRAVCQLPLRWNLVCNPYSVLRYSAGSSSDGADS